MVREWGLKQSDLGNMGRIPRGTLPRKRELQRATGMKIREPVSGKIRRRVLEKANYKCQWKRCKVKSPMPLDVHHMNMKNYDNRLSNFKVFCPTHHRMWHQKYKLKKEKNILGLVARQKVIKVKQKKTTKRKKLRNNNYGINDILRM
ncbi:MAG: hypothetical protein AABW80_01000 [Nanoarchaeota archaeon]